MAKHLTLDNRISIQEGLVMGRSLWQIALNLAHSVFLPGPLTCRACAA